MANETTTTAPMPAKRLRGRALPGSRTSAARLDTVSSPVKASIASEREKTSELKVGAVPRSTPAPRPSRDRRSAKPSTIKSRCATTASTAMKIAAAYMRARRARRIAATPRIAPTPITTSHGESVIASQPTAVPK
jgi:hypothetical protein